MRENAPRFGTGFGLVTAVATLVVGLILQAAPADAGTAEGNRVSARWSGAVNTGAAPDAHATPVPKDNADRAFDAATCIGCGACVAACPNASSMLFTAAKVTHLGLMPQGQPERARRTRAMVTAMDAAGFGNCTNHYECEAACPKDISRDVMALMNRDHAKAAFGSRERDDKPHGGG